jgi:hypothetical protein
MAAGCSGFNSGDKVAIWDYPSLSYPRPAYIQLQINSERTVLQPPIDAESLPAEQVAEILEAERSPWYQYVKEVARLPGHPFRPVALEICEESFFQVSSVRRNTFDALSRFIRDVRLGRSINPVFLEIQALPSNKRRALLVTVYLLDYPSTIFVDIAKRAFDITFE